MRHSLPLVLLFLLACGDDDDPDVARDCDQALRDNLPSGSPCDFGSSCGEGCGRQLVCVRGALSFVIAACDGGIPDAGDVVVVSACQEALDMNLPAGTPCDFTDECTRECSRHVSCEGGGLRVMVASCDASLDSGDAGADSGDAGEVPLCDDYTPPPPVDPACTSDAMCEDGRSCRRQHDARCGACIALPSLCASDTDCEGTDVCVETTHPCACAGPGTECQAACSGDSCGEGFTCGSDGHCDATSCTEGYECAPNFDCVFGAAGGDAHGCARRGCTATSDCACGACVSGECSSGPGACQFPTA